MNLDILVDRNISPSASCNPTQLSPQVDVDLQAEELLVHGMSREDGAASCANAEDFVCFVWVGGESFVLVEELEFWSVSWFVGWWVRGISLP